MPDKRGVDSIKSVLSFLAATGEAVELSLDDDKFNFADAPNFLKVLTTVMPAISNIKNLGAEVRDLDATERAELVAHFKDEFHLTNAVAEARVESAIDMAIKLAEVGFQAADFVSSLKGE